MTDPLHRQSDSQIAKIGSALFKLREPHTVESIRRDAAHAEERKTWACRRGWHRRVVIGDVHIPDQEENLLASIFAVLGSSDVESLMRCERCGAISEKPRF